MDNSTKMTLTNSELSPAVIKDLLFGLVGNKYGCKDLQLMRELEYSDYQPASQSADNKVALKGNIEIEVQ